MLAAIGAVTTLLALGIGLGAVSAGSDALTPMLGTIPMGLYAAAIAGVGFLVGGLWRPSLAADIAALVVIATFLVDPRSARSWGCRTSCGSWPSRRTWAARSSVSGTWSASRCASRWRPAGGPGRLGVRTPRPARLRDPAVRPGAMTQSPAQVVLQDRDERGDQLARVTRRPGAGCPRCGVPSRGPRSASP